MFPSRTFGAVSFYNADHYSNSRICRASSITLSNTSKTVDNSYVIRRTLREMAAANEAVVPERGETRNDGVIACKEETNTTMKQLHTTLKIRTTIAIFLLVIAISEIAVLHWRISTLLKDKLAKNERKVSKKNYTSGECRAIQRQALIASKFQKTMILQGFSNLSLFCIANGSPEPAIRWEYDQSVAGARYNFPSRGNLQITNITKADSKVIKCIAENKLGKDIQETTLDVHMKPKIILQNATAHWYVGKPKEMYCNASGNPLPKLKWGKSTGTLTGTQSLSSDGRSLRLVIKNPQITDNGNYFCTAENYVGKANKSFHIKFIAVLRDCSLWRKNGFTKNGLYPINPDGKTTYQAYCDMTTSNGGWTVFQRRQDGSVDFYKTWNEYKNGFGSVSSEFWLGNDKIYELTQRKDMMIRFDLEDKKGDKAYAEYRLFYIEDESKKYKLHVGRFNGGTAGDSFTKHGGWAFSTKDRDNDGYEKQCSQIYRGAWWYFYCHFSCLNGRYLNGPYRGSYSDGVIWNSFRGPQNSLTKTEMKVRPKVFNV